MPQYQGVWSLQQQMQALTSGQWATDPLFDYTTLLLQADNAANSAQNNTFLDSSTNAFAITRNGNTTQGTFSPFSLQPGAWGNYFDGSSALYVAANNAFVFGTGDFTIEFWIYQTAAWSINNIINNLSAGNQSWAIEVSSGNISFSGYNTTFLNGGTQPSINAWHHVAVCRSGTTLSMFVDGVRTATTTDSTNFASNNTLTIGYYYTYYVNGYVSNVRLVKGTAVYNPSSSTCTVPTAPLTAISGTSLLTCQSNRFIDNSSNAFAVLVSTGTPSVQAFSPFAPQFQYTASGTGGSGYFDGGGDFVSAADNTALQLGSVDFTIEFWAYFPSGFSGTKWIGGKGDAASTTGSAFSLYSTGFDFYSGSTTYTLTAPTWIASQWYHIAIVRNGTASNNLKLYINGAVQSQASVSTNTINTGGANALKIGEYSSGSPVSYISGYRLVKGTAVYTAAFTPPTAPPTAVTNTNLLLNFTNAGILDGTMKNNLETVADAKISTSVVKYGSGSMYFDGTGDYLTAPASPNNNLNIGDFTIEFWVYRANLTGDVDIVGCGNSTTTGYQVRIKGTTGYAQFLVVGGATITTTTGISATTWTHIAIVRSGTTVKIYINGTDGGGSGTVGNSGTVTTELLVVGANRYDYSNTLNGYMDDVRITKGIARYTQNFTPPSVALPRQ